MPDLLAPTLRWLIKERRAPIPQHLCALLLYPGGDIPCDGEQISSVACGESLEQMRAWAIRYPWREPQPSPWQWRADIGIQRIDGQWRFSLAMRYGLPASYLGPPLPPPPMVAPSVVRAMLSDASWDIGGSHTFPLTTQPHRLALGSGHLLAAGLREPTRSYPIIYLSCPPSGKYLIDPARLAGALAGSGIVVVADDPRLDIELGYLLPWAFRCVGGALRLYLPGADLDDPDDAARHRHLEPEALRAIGPEAPAYIAAAITRWADAAFQGWITTPEDVRALVCEERLAIQRVQDQAKMETLEEYVRLMEGENAQLHEQIHELSARFDQYRAQIAQVEELSARLQALSSERDRSVQALRQAEARLAQADTQQVVVAALRELPDSLPGLLDLLARLFPARVVVTSRAVRSAESASLERARDARAGWRLLHALATTMYDLVFAEPPVADLDAVFQRQTGIEAAFGEGKQTNRNERMMALRRDIDDRGQPIDITPHLKLGERPPRLLRVHFAIDRERRLLIIGHCGDHLETFGTQWNG